MPLFKQCPSCGRAYDDLTFSFCLDDGAVLAPPGDGSALDEYETEIATVVRQAQPTVVMKVGESEPATITEPSILITVNRLYKPDISAEMLYEITRGVWRVSERRNKAKYAFAVFKGIVREVYEIDSWHPAPDVDSDERKDWISEKKITIGEVTSRRWQFNGRVAVDKQHYVGRNVAHYRRRGDANPVKYLNC